MHEKRVDNKVDNIDSYRIYVSSPQRRAKQTNRKRVVKTYIIEINHGFIWVWGESAIDIDKLQNQD